jgi:hypothetical protein
MKILYISHEENDCFLEESADFKFNAFVDKRCLYDIYNDNKYSLDQYQLILCHPKHSSDTGWNYFTRTVFFSGGYKKTFIRTNACHIPKELFIANWLPFLKMFIKFNDLEKAAKSVIAFLSPDKSMESIAPLAVNQGDNVNCTVVKNRHSISNINGPRILLNTANDIAGHTDFPDFDAPAINHEEFAELNNQLEHAEQTLQNNRFKELPVPLCNFNHSRGLIKDSKVLLVDDEHRRGWSSVFGLILCGDSNKVHDLTMSPESWQKKNGLFAIDDIGDNFVPEDLSNLVRFLGNGAAHYQYLPFDLLLLDYRAKGEDISVHPKDVSGTRIIKLIKKIDPSLPIIIVTASENYKTFRQLILYGILGYYVKANQKIPEETRSDYMNLCSMIQYAQEKSYWRDLWNIVLWVRSKPVFRDIYTSEIVFKKISTELAKNGKTHRYNKDKLSLLLFRQVMPALINGVSFIYRQSQSIMHAHTIAVEDPDAASGHSIDIYRWNLFQLSAISDYFYLNAQAEVGAICKENPLFEYNLDVCKHIRNLTMHPTGFEPVESDLFILIICLVYVLFSDELENQRIARLHKFYDAKKIMQFEELFSVFYAHALKERHHDMIQTNQESPENFLTSLHKENKKRRVTDLTMLHTTYMLLFKTLEKNSEGQLSWRYLLQTLISDAITRHCKNKPMLTGGNN